MLDYEQVEKMVERIDDCFVPGMLPEHAIAQIRDICNSLGNDSIWKDSIRNLTALDFASDRETGISFVKQQLEALNSLSVNHRIDSIVFRVTGWYDLRALCSAGYALTTLEGAADAFLAMLAGQHLFKQGIGDDGRERFFLPGQWASPAITTLRIQHEGFLNQARAISGPPPDWNEVGIDGYAESFATLSAIHFRDIIKSAMQQLPLDLWLGNRHSQTILFDHTELELIGVLHGH